MNLPLSTEQIIKAAVNKFTAHRGSKMIHAGGRPMHVHTPGERILYLPNGSTVRVTVDDSGITTHIEDNNSLHGIVRPPTYRLRFGQ